MLEYFDAYLIGLTATPSKQTFGFFHQNLVMEYNHEMAVADGVNVNYDVYRIRTADHRAGGSKVEAGYSVQIQERDTRKKRWEQLDDDFSYDPNQLDRDVVAPDQIRTIVRTFRDKLFTEIFPGRTWVPKTLIFAKDDAHAENIVEIVREEFGKGNDFAQKITYRTTGAKPKDLINEFRTSPMPRIAVTVDMIATGTDIKAVEVVMFMRAVKSRAFFEQMKGRGVRVIKARRPAKRNARRQGQGPLRHRRRRGRLRAGQDRLAPHGAEAHRQLREAPAGRRLRQHRGRRAHLARRAARAHGAPHQRRRRQEDPRRQRRLGPQGPEPTESSQALDPDAALPLPRGTADAEGSPSFRRTAGTDDARQRSRAPDHVHEAVKPLHDPKLREAS